MRIGIIGAGHAGVEAARTAAQQGAEVTLYSQEAVLPYFRPKLIALAFGQVEEPQISQHPASWYEERNIVLRVGARIESIHPDRCEVVAAGLGGEFFDALILAIGAGPAVPPFAREVEGMVPLWTIEHARKIRQRVSSGARLIITGGGLIGIESALRAAEVGLHVTVVEKLPTLMNMTLSRKAGQFLAEALEKRGVRVITGRGVAAVQKSGADGCHVSLDDGEALEADIGLVGVGVRQDPGLARAAGLAVGRGVCVDSRLKASVGNIFAAGDIAEVNGQCRCSVPDALAQGKLAGANAVAWCRSEPLADYRPGGRLVFLKAAGFELRSAGTLPGEGTQEIALEDGVGPCYRCRIEKKGIPVGVQMVGDCHGFDALVKTMKEDLE